jgi:hypothetical protein
VTGRRRLEAEAFAAEARLLACELEIEQWLRLRAEQQRAACRSRPSPVAADFAPGKRLPGATSPVADEDRLDRGFARLMLETPSHYPNVRGMTFEQVVRIVRRQRLGTLCVRAPSALL